MELEEVAGIDLDVKLMPYRVAGGVPQRPAALPNGMAPLRRSSPSLVLSQNSLQYSPRWISVYILWISVVRISALSYFSLVKLMDSAMHQSTKFTNVVIIDQVWLLWARRHDEGGHSPQDTNVAAPRA